MKDVFIRLIELADDNFFWFVLLGIVAIGAVAKMYGVK